MSNKTYILQITTDAILRKQIRGTIPLRGKQIHKHRNEKRTQNRQLREMQDWE